MQVDLMSYESLIAILALFLITIFCLAAFSDRRWSSSEPPNAFRFDHTHDVRPKRDTGDDKDRTSSLYLRYADLSACSVGAETVEKQIRFHAHTHHNPEENSPKSAGASLP